MAELRVLLIEDDEADVELVRRALRRSGLAATVAVAQTAQEMTEALAREVYDVILSDYSLPAFGAEEVLSLARAADEDVPVIVVSGSLGEERAVELLRGGARDFVLKDRLARLVPAIERECREARLRKESRELRSQLLAADRMASLGMIASGVAHEIYNPLGVLMGWLGVAQKLARKVPTDGDRLPSELTTALERANEAAEHIREIAADIRSFSRSEQQDARRPVSPAAVVASSLRLLSAELRPRARVEQVISSTRWVMGHPGKLGQVLLNLLVNAAQSIPRERFKEGIVTISVRDLGALAVEIEVADNGCGIAEGDLARVLEPFYTTKPPGQGTGLGLPICQRLVEELGGTLSLHSVQGEGRCRCACRRRSRVPRERAESASAAAPRRLVEHQPVHA